MSIKIKANKLIKRLAHVGGCGAKPDTFEDGWDKAITEAIGIVREEYFKVKSKKKAKKADKSEVIPIQNTLVSELCPECDTEITVSWDVDTDGFKVFCPNCGEQLMLCSACKDREYLCDWNDEAQACYRCREQTDCERCVFAVEDGDGESLHYECRHPDADYVGIINAIGNCELFEPNA